MTCNNKEIGDRPTLVQLTIRIWQKKLNVSAIKMFELYENRGWKNATGEPLKDLDAAIGRLNTFEHFKREPGELRKEKDILLNTDEWKDYCRTVHQYYHNECQRCGKKGPLEVHHLRYYHAKGDTKIPSRLPWDYSMKDVVSLCRTCHNKEHKVEVYSEHKRLSGFDPCST